MYCEINDLRRLLPQQITIGATNIGTPNPGRPTTKRDSFTEPEAIVYIGYAQQEIDGRLGGQFFCPLRRVKTFETEMLENVLAGTNVKVRVHDSGAFSVGQLVRLQDNDKMETATVTTLAYLTEIILDKVKYNYNFETGIISILEYPDPIPLITARLAVSYAFDELFVAEQAPNISEYGKEQRKLALNSLDSILTGTILLFGQDYVGRRFLRGTLLDAYDSPTREFQFGREKQ
jgi:hypothetical protein